MADKKVIILGGAGMFGWDMARILGESDGWEPVALTRQQLDITDTKALTNKLSEIRPYAVVNTVGPLVDICEEQPALADQINIEIPERCAQLCQKIDAIFVHLSTCGVFGNEVRYYTEKDPVVLKTEYARSKYEGEKAVLAACHRSIVVRPGWMYGATLEHKKNFVAARLREAAGKDHMQSATDKVGCPTWTADAADAVLQMIQIDGLHEVIHLNNTGGGSRAEYVQQIVKSASLDVEVEGVDSSAFPRNAEVPDCELLDNGRLNSLLNEPMPDWRDSLGKYIQGHAT